MLLIYFIMLLMFDRSVTFLKSRARVVSRLPRRRADSFCHYNIIIP